MNNYKNIAYADFVNVNTALNLIKLKFYARVHKKEKKVYLLLLFKL